MSDSSANAPDINPRLVALSGSMKGTSFAVRGQVSLGRESANSVSLNEASISRRHCVIEGVEGQFRIVDLDSFNGTFVNGIPVKEQTLSHGDQIAVGRVMFLFLIHEAEAEVTRPVQLDDALPGGGSTVRLSQEHARYLHPEIVSGLSPTSRVMRDLNTLLKISATINSLRGLSELQRRLLELILEVIPAERGAILLYAEDEDEFTSICGWNRLTGMDSSMKVSRTITDQVLHERVAVLSNNVFENESMAEAASLIASNVGSVLCVPLLSFEKVLGVIYLDTTDQTTPFDEEHLQLLTGIAGIASVAFENARHLEWLEDQNQRLHQAIQIEHRMIGESRPIQKVYEMIGKIAPSGSTVLIRGESGTGKELAARAIHSNSPRAQKPFVAINCATLSETLLESELFGHEKGAFTGAIAQKRGKFEVADGGTLFLDEVGELTPPIQAKLLRVLQEQEFERVGGTRPIKVDVRIIAATNRDLEQALKAKTFRQDLYYRFNVVSLTVPSLRERREDIPLLANYFASVYAKKCKRRLKGISPEARALLHSYDWPGNVRELENAIEHAVVLGSTELITPEDLPDAVCEAGDAGSLPPTRYHEALKEAKRRVITKAIEEADGNYTEAANLLGIHPNNLHRLIRNLGLKGALGK